MRSFENEGDFEGDWEERGEVAWGEGDWRKYLSRTGDEVEKFLAYYREFHDDSDRLDKVACLMGWDAEEWLDTESMLPSGCGRDPNQPYGCEEEELVDDGDTDPYTLHRHPIFVASQALYIQIRKEWGQILARSADNIPQKTVWGISESLHLGESNAILAVQALDMGDFALTVCHLKLALSAVNETLKLHQGLPRKVLFENGPFHESCCACLFDLREVWLRTIRDSREQAKRYFGESE